ncbi:MAG: GDP-mannose 4,6-dehydratase [Candidatus Aenigmarchaeota archaeon]|nr:GDP-mannose 4,6-dehydratase [Candidatus Aenigmarchaeota archaeon]
MNRALITGGLGFLGSHLARELAGNYEILIVDEGKSEERVEDVKKSLQIIRMSLTDPQLKDAINQFEPDTIFHLGAFTLPFREKSFLRTSMESNIFGTVSLLEALENTNVKSFIYASSSEIYGSVNKAPFREDMVPRPTSPYSAGKLAGEHYSMLYHDTYGFPATVLRLFNIYGSWQTPNRIIPELIVSCLKKQTFRMTKGEQTREFNYVKDIVDALIAAAKTGKAKGEIINVGCGKGIPIKDVVEKILDIMGHPIQAEASLPYRENEIWQMHSDSNKALKLLNWKSRYSIEDGLRETATWYKEQWEKNRKSICFEGA